MVEDEGHRESGEAALAVEVLGLEREEDERQHQTLPAVPVQNERRVRNCGDKTISRKYETIKYIGKAPKKKPIITY